MKIVELTAHRIAITNEEADLLNQFDDETPTLVKGKMTERQQIMANQLVNKDILLRKNENGQLIYKRSTR